MREARAAASLIAQKLGHKSATSDFFARPSHFKVMAGFIKFSTDYYGTIIKYGV